MKTSLYSKITALLILLVNTFVFAQMGNTFNYQAIARNASGTPISNQLIALSFTIRNDSANGTPVYLETQQSILTNQFGLFTAKIGSVNPVAFSAIDWKNGDKFLQVQFDAANSGNFVDMGTTQLLSVPYALVSKKASDMSLNELNNVSSTAPNTDEALSWNGNAWAPASIKNDSYQKEYNGFSSNQRNTIVPDTGLYFIPEKSGTYLVTYLNNGNYDQSFINTAPASDGTITTFVYDLNMGSYIFRERSAISALESASNLSAYYRIKDQPFTSSIIAQLYAGHKYQVSHYMSTTGTPLPVSDWYVNWERLIAVRLY